GSSGNDKYTSITTSTYNFNTSETTTTGVNQNWTFALNAPGSYSSGGTYSLNSFAYSGSGPANYSLQLASTQNTTGTSINSTTVNGSSNATTANYAYTSGSGGANYTAQSNSTVNYGAVS